LDKKSHWRRKFDQTIGEVEGKVEYCIKSKRRTVTKEIAIVDNFDSFTYNLVHALEAMGADCNVMRNDSIDQSILEHCKGIVLGPGPGLPEEAGDLMNVIQSYHERKPILGICLGHQALGQYFGGQLVNLKQVFHGVESQVNWVTDGLLNQGLSIETTVGLYHSWSIELPDSSPLQATCFSEQGVLMGLRHTSLPLQGLQFHPESIMTPFGRMILKNWIDSLA
jgi:anthranilate synthase component II